MSNDFEEVQTCEACDSVCEDFIECDMCHWLGCERCMVPGDDVYPYLCADCAGEGYDGEVPDDD